MPVRIEAISVVVRRDANSNRFDGGWVAFTAGVPKGTLYYDAEIARVGFMSPEDARAYVYDLESGDLRYLLDDEAQDIAVVDQLQGFLASGPGWRLQRSTTRRSVAASWRVDTMALPRQRSHCLDVGGIWAPCPSAPGL